MSEALRIGKVFEIDRTSEGGQSGEIDLRREAIANFGFRPRTDDGEWTRCGSASAGLCNQGSSHFDPPINSGYAKFCSPQQTSIAELDGESTCRRLFD